MHALPLGTPSYSTLPAAAPALPQALHAAQPAPDDDAPSPPLQVTCVIASTGHSSQEEVDQLVKQLQQSGAMAHTTVVAAGPDATLGERYAALCTACSLGERVRDDGGHALVVLDDLRPLLQVGAGACMPWVCMRACVRVRCAGGWRWWLALHWADQM